MSIFDSIEGEPLRDALGYMQNSMNARQSAAQHARMQQAMWANNQQLQQISSLLRHQVVQQEQEKARIRSLPQCPYCGGRIEGKFSVCQHCKNNIHWLFGILPHMDGHRDELYREVQNIIIQAFSDATELVEQEEAEDKKRKQKEQEEEKNSFRVQMSIAITFVIVSVVLLAIGLST